MLKYDNPGLFFETLYIYQTTGMVQTLFIMLLVMTAHVSGQGDTLIKPDKKMPGMNRALLYKKWRAGIGFTATGNEPSWGLDLHFKKYILFYTAEGDTLKVPTAKPARAANANIVRYRSHTPRGTLTIEIFGQECTNSVSGEKSDYRVAVDVQRGTSTSIKHYEGCGEYVPDFRLEGKWVLRSMNGVAVDTVNYPRGTPNLEIRAAEGRFSGSAGCNRMMGRLMTTGEQEIRFSRAATTLMMCSNIAKESEFLKVLEKIHTYQNRGNQWKLYGLGDVALVFSRAVEGK